MTSFSALMGHSRSRSLLHMVFIGYGLHLPEAKYDDFDSPEMPFRL